jgi:hypothetical protein
MNSQDFQQLLEHPRALYDLPLASLQQLAMDYPYSQNLRLLLLLKSHLEGHPDESDYLNRCAAAAFDRAFVYDLLQDTKRYEPANREDTEVLELRTLEDIALADAALPAAPDNTAPPPDERSLNYEEIFPDWEEEEDDGAPSVETLPPVTSPVSVTDAWVATAIAFLGVLPEYPHSPAATEDEIGVPLAPEPVTHFTGGKHPEAQSSLRDRLRSIRRRQAGKMALEQEEVRQIARRSLVAQEAVASETLAALLVRQGQYKNAIKMYQHLELLYPEKKTIFAGLIKELKKKL